MWLIRAFHPVLADTYWLRERFSLFCERKRKSDIQSHRQRMEHAPMEHRRMIYRELGRENVHSTVLLYEKESDIQRYVSLIAGHHPRDTEAPHIITLSLTQGPLADMVELVKALDSSPGDHRLTVTILQLVECIHIACYCHMEYRDNTPKEFRWVVDYIKQLTDSVLMNNMDFDGATQCNGMQMEVVISRVLNIVATTFGNKKPMDRSQSLIHVWHSNCPLPVTVLPKKTMSFDRYWYYAQAKKHKAAIR